MSDGKFKEDMKELLEFRRNSPCPFFGMEGVEEKSFQSILSQFLYEGVDAFMTEMWKGYPEDKGKILNLAFDEFFFGMSAHKVNRYLTEEVMEMGFHSLDEKESPDWELDYSPSVYQSVMTEKMYLKGIDSFMEILSDDDKRRVRELASDKFFRGISGRKLNRYLQDYWVNYEPADEVA